jgi:hypothetical protein
MVAEVGQRRGQVFNMCGVVVFHCTIPEEPSFGRTWFHSRFHCCVRQRFN